MLEEKNWTEVEDIHGLVEKRKKYLVEEFGRLRIFETDQISKIWFFKLIKPLDGQCF